MTSNKQKNPLVYCLENGMLKLDGGAMFGVVPKTMWNEVYPSDEKNMVSLSMRSLLIIDDNRKILIDTGIGDKQDNKFFSHYQRTGTETITESLKQAGYTPDEITDVFLTHLHFDHCGGCLTLDSNGKPVPVFKNAVYSVGRRQWNCALEPNRLEKASFRKENFLPLHEAGVLKLIDVEGFLSPSVEVRFFDGHTIGQAVFLIHSRANTLVHVADVIPVAAHIPVPYICAYDIQPLLTVTEKESLLNESVRNKYTLFFGHDAHTECCTVIKTEKGYRPGRNLTVTEWMNEQ